MVQNDIIVWNLEFISNAIIQVIFDLILLLINDQHNEFKEIWTNNVGAELRCMLQY